MPLGRDLVPYSWRHFFNHFKWPCLASGGISEQATCLALFLQSAKQSPRVCQRVDMIVLFNFALSSTCIPANCIHSSPSLSLNSAQWRSFLTDGFFTAPFLFLSFLFFLFFVVAPFTDLTSVSASLSVPSSTALNDAGRLALKRFRRMPRLSAKNLLGSCQHPPSHPLECSFPGTAGSMCRRSKGLL